MQERESLAVAGSERDEVRVVGAPVLECNRRAAHADGGAEGMNRLVDGRLVPRPQPRIPAEHTHMHTCTHVPRTVHASMGGGRWCNEARARPA